MLFEIRMGTENHIVGFFKLMFLTFIFVDYEGKTYKLFVLGGERGIIVTDRHCPVGEILEPDLGTCIIELGSSLSSPSQIVRLCCGLFLPDVPYIPGGDLL